MKQKPPQETPQEPPSNALKTDEGESPKTEQTDTTPVQAEPPQQEQPPEKNPQQNAEQVAEDPKTPSLLEDVNGKVAELVRLLDPLTAGVAEIARKRIQTVRDFQMEDHDLRMEYAIVVRNADGEVFQVRSIQDFPDITSDDLFPEAMKTFQETFHNNVVRPVFNRFTKYLNSRVSRVLRPGNAPMIEAGAPPTPKDMEQDLEIIPPSGVPKPMHGKQEALPPRDAASNPE